MSDIHKNYFFRDPIHQFIEVTPQEKEIIDHPYFQRLRRIKQLGMSHYVYHGAEHSRFGHSLGVLHLATKIFDVIVRKNKDKLEWKEEETKRYRQLLRLAALLHDIGHAPFSHVAEDKLMPLRKNLPNIGQDPNDYKTKAKHEDYTGAVILETEIKTLIENNFKNIKAGEIWMIIQGKPLISPENALENWKNPSPLLNKIISGELDADRMDYLLRDSYYTGVKYGIYDVERLIQALNIEYSPEDNSIWLAIDEDGIFAAEELVMARYHMFTQIYFHPIRRIYDHILTQFLIKEANIKELKFEIKDTDENSTIINQFPYDIKEYLKLDDSVIENNILEAYNNNPTKESYAKRLIERKHYKDIYATLCHKDRSEGNSISMMKTILEMKNILVEYSDSASTAISKLKLKYDKGEGGIKVLLEYNKPSDYLHVVSKVIEKITQEINIERMYVHQDKYLEAKEIVKDSLQK